MPNLERNSWLPGWVSDLPRLWSRDARFFRPMEIRLKDPNVVAQINGLAKTNNITKAQVLESFIAIGTQLNNDTIISRDQMGFEKRVDLMDEDFAPEQGGGRSFKIRFTPIIPTEVISIFLKVIANRYYISPEELIIRICKLGIRIAQAENNSNIIYMLRIQGGEDIDLTGGNLFNLFDENGDPFGNGH